MAKYLVVLSNPVDGREDEYNEWYDNIHLQEVVALNGFSSGQRFKMPGNAPLPSDHRYMALYEIDGDPAEAVNELLSSVSKLNMSSALDTQSAKMMVFEAMGKPVTGS